MSTPRTHPLNVSYLVVGLVFLGVSASWALREAGAIDLAEVRWLLPATLVVAGLVGVAAMALKGLSRSDAPGDDTYGDHSRPMQDDPFEGETR